LPCERFVRKHGGCAEEFPPRPNLGLELQPGHIRECVFQLFQNFILPDTRLDIGFIPLFDAARAKLIRQIQQKSEASFRLELIRISARLIQLIQIDIRGQIDLDALHRRACP
jgi:hypothetical protein